MGPSGFVTVDVGAALGAWPGWFLGPRLNALWLLLTALGFVTVRLIYGTW